MPKQPNILKRWWKEEWAIFTSIFLFLLPEWLIREKLMEQVPTWVIEIAFAFVVGCIVWISLNTWEISRQERKLAKQSIKSVAEIETDPNTNIAIIATLALTLIAGLVILNKRKSHGKQSEKP